MTMRLYNSLTNRLEDFQPIDPTGKQVTFYTCGPTVYDYAHIGNFRSFLNADVLRRTLELFGYEVRQVMNMTDVGHMTDDEVADGAGEDKMEAAARRIAEDKKSGKLPADAQIDPGDPYAIAEFYIRKFLRDAASLGMRIADEARTHPELMPRPTQYIDQMIELVRTLTDGGHAYVGDDGVVYFDVQSFPDYGALSGNTPDAIRSGEGGRVDESTQSIKKHPADFMLWKPDASHLMKWPSPWGEGYPGWHLECSVMAETLLGQETNGIIDIHSGGEDNIFPHHECEIAQSRCVSGEKHFARYWFHTRYLLVDGDKMAKSKGNFYKLHDLQARGASPAAVRLELIKTHYRSNSNFMFQSLKDSQRQIDKWNRLRDWLTEHADDPMAHDGAGRAGGAGPLESALEPFKQALGSDLNVSGAIGALNEALGQYTLQSMSAGEPGAPTYASELAALQKMDSVLGVLDLASTPGAEFGGIDESAVQEMLDQRNAARAQKDWAEADRIRDELLEMGIAIKDDAVGTSWSRVLH